MYNLADWSKAPDWAMYHAVDMVGCAWWYNVEPRAGETIWTQDCVVKFDRYIINMDNIDWTQTLEARP